MSLIRRSIIPLVLIIIRGKNYANFTLNFKKIIVIKMSYISELHISVYTCSHTFQMSCNSSNMRIYVVQNGTSQVLKSTVFCVLISCSSKRARHFGETCHLYLQGLRVSQARNHKKPDFGHISPL
jgi:hypothetical protein